jgi:hypothetical protein
MGSTPNDDDDEDSHEVSNDELTMLENLFLAEDKFEAAIAMQPEAVRGTKRDRSAVEGLLPGSPVVVPDDEGASSEVPPPHVACKRVYRIERALLIKAFK